VSAGRRARLTRDEAVAWVIAQTRCRTRRFAVKTVREAEQGSTPYGMTFDGTHWTVPAFTVQRGTRRGKS
jgi:hypothetical protein